MAGGNIEIEKLLELAIKQSVADLHLQAGSKPIIRLNGRLEQLDTKVLSAEDTTSLFRSLGGADYQAQVDTTGSIDFAFNYQNKARFRVNTSKVAGDIKLTLRRIPSLILPVDQLSLPDNAIKLINGTRGLILVTGPTGSGKTTTLASLISHLAKTKSRNIIMIEHPTEYIIPSGVHSLVSQRAVSIDVPSFHQGLVDALRMDPDVIVVGELREPETVLMALEAADTGHLVFGTLHTTSAVGSVDRILNMVGSSDTNRIRSNLAANLRGIICQQLVRKKDGKGVVAANEFLIGITAVQALIRAGNLHQIPSAMDTGKKYGMRSLDNHLFHLVTNGVISADDAIEKANEPDALSTRIQRKSVTATNDLSDEE